MDNLFICLFTFVLRHISLLSNLQRSICRFAFLRDVAASILLSGGLKLMKNWIKLAGTRVQKNYSNLLLKHLNY